MRAQFRRYLLASTATHIGIVLLLIVTSLILTFRQKRKPYEIMTFIDVEAALSAPALQPVESIQVPEPPALEPPKDIPEATKKKKAEIKKSEKRIKRTETPAKPPPPNLTPEEIKKLLASGIKTSPTAQPMGTAEFDWYMALVRQTMYDAWAQPSELAGRGLMTVVSIRVSRDGAVSGREMVKSSGNSVMDESVMRAVRSVSRLKSLPAQYAGPYKDITIEFELTGATF